MNRVLNKLNKIVLYLLAILSLFFLSVATNISAKKNKIFNNLTIGDTLLAKNLTVSQNLTIGGNVTIIGTFNSPSVVNTQGISVPDAVAVFADNTGNLIKSSGVKIDEAGNIEINGITKNGITTSWPSVTGAAFSYLATDGANNLYYGTGSSGGGGGNVRTNSVFTADNRILTTDTLTSATNIKESLVTIDASNNMTGVNSLAANNITATLVGNASTADQAPTFTGVLAGDVSGGINSTQVDFIGTKPASVIAAAVIAGNNATFANNANAIVARNGAGNFAANVISANLIGAVTGNLTGQATSATTATNASYFLQPLQGDVIGTQTATVVNQVASKSALDVAYSTSVISTATSNNIALTIVKRDGAQNFSANNITASLAGNVTGNVYGQAGSAVNVNLAQNFTTPLVGNVQGNQATTQIISVGTQAASYISSGVDIASTATSDSVSGAVVRRDEAGNFSAHKIIADLIGSVTGNLYGTADTATSAVSANFANIVNDFTGIFLADVIGTQSATVVHTVGTKLATVVSADVDLVESATSENIINTIVKRDNLGSFITNKISLGSSPVNAHDATTKTYVDTAVTQGIVRKDKARVVSTITTTTAGFQIVDGVTLVDNDRVLLIAQSAPSSNIYNGLWVAHSGPWTRPADFLAGTAAQRAYVIIDAGNTQDGSSWICSTPAAIIGTNDIEFAQFSMPDQTTADNVGTGTGKIFRDKIGVTLNLKSLQKSDHIIIDNNIDNVAIRTDANSEAIPDSIASRDLAQNVSGTLFGAASLNLLKSGGHMTGNLNMANGTQINLHDSSGVNYVGLKAPLSLISSYTIDLPTGAPVAGQFLQAASPSTTTWANIGGLPSVGKNYYVSLAGSDSTSNDGSIYSPYRTVKHAVAQASLVASNLNPVVIVVGAGTFVEDNSVGATPSGPIAINNSGISITGSSISGTIIKPLDSTSDLFTTTISYASIANLTLQADAGSGASAFRLDSSGYGKINFNSVAINGFNIGLDLNRVTGANGINPEIFLQDLQCEENIKAISVDNIPIVIKNSIFKGSPILPAANVGIEMAGAGSSVEVFDTDFILSETSVLVKDQAYLYCFGCSFSFDKYGLAFYTGSRGNILGSTFYGNETSDSVKIIAQDSPTLVYLNGCLLNCADLLGTATGTGVKVTGQGQVYFCNSTIEKAAIGVECGTSGDDNNTVFVSSFLNLMYCPIDIQQRGTARMLFVGGAIETETLDIEDPTYVSCSAFNSNGETTLSFGNTFDVPEKIYKIENGQTNPPFLDYEPNVYSSRGMMFQNLNGGDGTSIFNGIYSKANNSTYYAVTGDRTRNAKIHLKSDTGGLGVGADVCEWEIGKIGSQADLAFTYTRNDGDFSRGPNVVMQLNGLANNIEFPEATVYPLPTNTVAQLVWASEANTNLYRYGAGVLATDGDIITGTLSPNFALIADANSMLASSGISTTTLNYLSNVTAPVQTQLNNKVAKSGGIDAIMTGSLILPAGSVLSPSLQFAGSPGTGLSTLSTNTLVFSTVGIERMKITGDGDLYIDQLSVSGVLHNDSVGKITSSLITSTDIDANAAIEDTKLAQIASAGKVADYATTATAINVAGAIVQRDLLGSFTATTIYANLVGNATDATSFTGSLSGNVTGIGSATVVSYIGTKTVSDISNAIDMVNSATSNNVASTIAKRDSSGNLAANIVTILAATTNITDASTKSYVDPAVSSYANNQVELLHRFNVISNGTNTITTDGLYTLTCNVTGNIVINADNVTIDMYGFTLNSATDPIILVGSTGGVGRQNIEIKNGKLRGTVSNNGIFVGANCSAIRFSNLEVYSCNTGIFFYGLLGVINRGKVENCNLDSCFTGVYLNYANKILFRNCKASNCVEKGFYQINCNYNVFDKCSALETINNSTSIDVAGFVSLYGRGNLFNSCVAEGTTKQYALYPDYSTRAIGFLLSGAEGSMENQSKIINSVANTTLVQTSSCTAYGVLLDPVLKSGTFPSLFVASTPTYSTFFVNKWSPDGNYLAVGGPSFSAMVFKFTGSSLVLVATAPTVGAAPVCAGLDWSPDGKYLAVGGYTGSNRIYVFRFDGSNLTSAVTPIDHGAFIFGLGWSPDGKYLAISGAAGTGSKIEVYIFNPAGSLSLVASLSPDGAEYKNITWSPCGKYLSSALHSAGGGFDSIQVFQFTGSLITRIASSNYYSSNDTVMTKWSPSGKYIVLAGDGAVAGSKVVVFKFDPSATKPLVPFSEYTHYTSGYTISADWSPNEKYLVFGATVAGAAGSTNLRVLPFTYGTMTPVAEKNYCFGGGTTQVNGVSISPNGKYLAVAGSAGYSSVYSLMDAPTNCLLQGNRICNATSYLSAGGGYSRQAIGICGSGSNLYLKNIGFANDVNFNRAVYNVYGTSLLSSDPKEFDNLWQPTYETGFGVNYNL